MIETKRRCLTCNQDVTLMVRLQDLDEMEKPKGARKPVQELFPYLSKAQREMFISQTCGACWLKLFAPPIEIFDVETDRVPIDQLPSHVDRVADTRDSLKGATLWFRLLGETVYHAYRPDNTYAGSVDMGEADLSGYISTDETSWGALPMWAKQAATLRGLNLNVYRFIGGEDGVFYVYSYTGLLFRGMVER